MPITLYGRGRVRASVVTALAASFVAACSGSDHNAGAGDTAAAPTVSSSAATGANAGDSAAQSGRTTVRGRLAAVSDTALTVTTRDGDVHVLLMQPVTIYTRAPATLADVRANTFVGVTSVPDPDGSQHATEIHIFPEALRGTGEGSYPLPQAGGASSRSTMTNGNVTSGGGAPSSRMTNGAARAQPGGTITVQYKGGEQTIKVPAGVSVTMIAPSHDQLTSGANVIVMAMKQPGGTLQSSTVFLARDTTSRH